jgi:hypothetical protein
VQIGISTTSEQKKSKIGEDELMVSKEAYYTFKGFCIALFMILAIGCMSNILEANGNDNCGSYYNPCYVKVMND